MPPRLSDRYLEERRAEILEAASRVFVRKGYDAATMQDIAAEADVAAGSIYRYFESKTDLIAAVLHQCCEDDRALFASVEEVTSPLGALLAVGAREREGLSDPDNLAQCMLRLESFLAAARDESLLDPVNETLEETQGNIAALLRAAQETGELDPSIDATDLAITIHAFVAGISALRLPMGDAMPAERAWDVMVRLVSSLFLVDPATLPGVADAADASPETTAEPAATPPQV